MVNNIPRNAIYAILETTTPKKGSNEVISSVPTFVALPMYTKDDQGKYTSTQLDVINIYPKNEFGNIVKTIDNPITQIGDEVTYKVTVKIPEDINRMTSFTVKDEPGEGLTLTELEKIEVEDVASYNPAQLKNTFTVAETGGTPSIFPIIGETPEGGASRKPGSTHQMVISQGDNATAWKNLAGKTVTFTYKGFINEAVTFTADKDDVKNTAKYLITNTGGDSNEMTSTVDSDTLIYKFAKNDSQTGKYLANAKFNVSKGATFDGNKKIKFVSLGNGIYRVATQAEINSGASNVDTQVQSDNRGYLELRGLDDITYTIRETFAPADYRIDEEDHNFTPSKGKESDADQNNDLNLNSNATDGRHNIYNTPESVLPSTGGTGVKVLMFVAVAGMATSAGFWVMKKRAED
jgi:fimbrial isopeptide formation D2 family protein/LPXTG-motif cell wall-anchored protein